MTRRVEAVFEHGLLRPLEPLALQEMEHVLVTVTDIPAPVPAPEPTPGYDMRTAEQEWLRVHSGEYLGQWVALQGRDLVSHGPDALAVRNEARSKGVQRPLMVRIPKQLPDPSEGSF